ncbi:class I SAM-dependent methyltransferase [Thermogemmatispora sp.]|uniref:class I SAM-dependent methyltransferase n=1 Tax=Thermogemmatispora sp. TaxID=1968838 RepID=UPI001D9FF6A9|nr:class I SAM-dependent methyltransferase [Thermogemmatispora sp.]MBX5449582.1 class I SAM-dependent methyltransferase [Thermogemmatispora sp.]
MIDERVRYGIRPCWERGTYVIEADDAAELARAMQLEPLVTRHMGGLFPERDGDLSGVQTILDVACGPGGWALAVAYAYPHVTVVGIDSCPAVVEYAQAQAWSRGLTNVEFIVMDALQPLDFPDDTFDLVNARFLMGMMPISAWLPLLRECRRVTRPGGSMRLLEAELCLTTSPAFEQLSAYLARALWRRGYSFSPDGRTLGITAVLGQLLRSAGWRDVGCRPFVIDFSTGSPAQTEGYQHFMLFWKLVQDFVCACADVAPETFERLYQQALAELLLDDFCGLWFHLLTWAVNPQF